MRIVILDNVYSPAEDSWQTAELLGWIVGNYMSNKEPRVIDVGSGTGVLTLTALLSAVNRGRVAWVIAIDHDRNAAVNTRINLVNNELYQYADVVSMNVMDAIRDGARIDVIVSNPPYLPGSWDEDWRIFGGPDGNNVIRQLVTNACGGNAHLIVLTQSSLSNWEETIELLRDCNYRLVMIKASHYFFEDIITMVFLKVNY